MKKYRTKETVSNHMLAFHPFDYKNHVLEEYNKRMKKYQVLSMRYKVVVCGGTFDHFHKGHRSLLKLAFSLGNKVVIGVTSDVYVQNLKFKIPTNARASAGRQNSKLVESFEKRKRGVLGFIKTEKTLNRVKIVEISDLFGPTLDKNLAIDAIVVSQNSKKGAEIINERRKKLGLKELNLLVVSRVLAEDGKLISSSRIRNGEIDREGKVYIRKEWFNKNLKLTDDLRGEFQKPFGDLLIDISSLSKNKNNLVITVGDITTKSFNEKSLGQGISVIDFKVAREIKFSNILELGFTGQENILKVDNPAGYITKTLFTKFAKIFKTDIKDKVILQVNGEEDLAVLPLVLLSPLNAVIYYGQRGMGVVRVVVSEESKNKAYNLILKLKPV